MSYPLVLVRWHDAWFEYEPPQSSANSYPVSTVGYLIRENSEVTSVAQECLTMAGEESFRGVTHIPTKIVDSVTDLEVREP